MSAERDAFLKTRAEFRDAERVLGEAENAAYRARMAFEAARRKMDDLTRRLGERRMREIAAGGQ